MTTYRVVNILAGAGSGGVKREPNPRRARTVAG
jgi:hypothetical protein